MKKLFFVPLFIAVFFSCAKEDEAAVSRYSYGEALGVEASVSPLGGNTLFFEDVTYGSGERQMLDVHIPETASSEGIIIFFHGGGFTGGDKSDAYNELLAPTMQTLLNQNMTLVSANYTLLTTSGNEGVISALEDGAAVINFLQSRFSQLNIPANKIVLAGVSAGAGIAQWNGFREQTNSQVQGILALAAQSTYDLYEWENVFPGFSLDGLRQMSTLLQLLFTQFYGGVPTQSDLDVVDYLSFMDATDPALYVYNTAGDEVINRDGEIDFDVLYHSFRHGDYLRAKAIEVSLEFSGIFQESPADFALRMLE